MFVTDALVLRRTDYRDYDRMVTLLSPTHGRIEACVRGVKKPKSPLLNASEPLCWGEFTLTPTKAGLSVTGCQIRESNYPIREDYDKLTHAAYCLFLLLLCALPEQPSAELFQLALSALAHLSYSELPNELITAAFEMHYMNHLGTSPRMDSCIHCGNEINSAARFDAETGGVVCPDCPSGASTRISDGARRIMLKTPRVAFDKVALLNDRPEWPEAGANIRRFLLHRIEQFPRLMPPLKEIT